MKKLIPLFLFVSTSAIAAGGPQQFVGRYKPDPEKCNNGFKSAERIYVKYEDSTWGKKGERAKALTFAAYGEDASGDEVLLGSGERQLPGTSIDAHGEVTQSWSTTTRGNVLKSFVTVKRPSLNYASRQVTILTAFKYGMRFEQEFHVRANPAIKREVCKLIAY